MGVVPGKSFGHNWICDGSQYIREKKRFVLYCLAFSDVNPNELIYKRVEQTPYEMYFDDGITYFHHVWGWGGQYDGWYLDDLSNLPSDIQYTSGRFDLIINSFN